MISTEIDSNRHTRPTSRKALLLPYTTYSNGNESIIDIIIVSAAARHTTRNVENYIFI